MRWFKFFTDWVDSPWMEAIIAEHGVEGFGRIVIILSILSRNSKGELSSVKLPLNTWAIKLRAKPKKLREFFESVQSISDSFSVRTDYVSSTYRKQNDYKIGMKILVSEMMVTIEAPMLLNSLDNYTERENRKYVQTSNPRARSREVEVEEEKKSLGCISEMAHNLPKQESASHKNKSISRGIENDLFEGNKAGSTKTESEKDTSSEAKEQPSGQASATQSNENGSTHTLTSLSSQAKPSGQVFDSDFEDIAKATIEAMNSKLSSLGIKAGHFQLRNSGGQLTQNARYIIARAGWEQSENGMDAVAVKSLFIAMVGSYTESEIKKGYFSPESIFQRRTGSDQGYSIRRGKALGTMKPEPVSVEKRKNTLENLGM